MLEGAAMMIRSTFFAVLLTLGFAALAPAQDTSKTITFSSPAASAKNLLAELSKVSGVTFNVSPQTQGEILLVDVKDVPLSELMKRIAQAAAADWKQEGESFRLIRSQALQNQQEREYLDARALRFKAEQGRIQQEISNLKPLTQAEAQKAAEAQKRATEEILSGQLRVTPGGSFNASPANRLLMKLLTAIAPGDLARIAPGTRTVLSSLPTRMQRPLPGASGRYINEFLQEYQTWLSAQPPAKQNEVLGDGPVLFSMGGGLVPMQGGLGKVLLVLTRNANQEDVQAQIKVADAQGNIVADQMRMLRTREISTAPQQNNAAAPQSGEKPIEISQTAKEHASFMNQSPSRGGPNVMFATPALPSGGGAGRVTVSTTFEAVAVGAPPSATPRLPVSPEWVQKLVQPEKNEPLGFAASELFLGAAKARGENIVASLPDSALLPLSSRALQQIAPTALLTLSQSNLDLKVENADGWLVVMPKFPAYVREVRVDRVELQRLLTGIQKDSRLALDNISRYASSRTNPAPAPAFDGRYVNALFPFAFQDFNQATFNWRMHQLYTTLSPDQRQNLGNGGAVSLGALSPKQSSIVRSMVYDDMAGPMYLEPQRPGQEPRNETRASFAFRSLESGYVFSGMSGGKLIEERTEFLPIGVPSDGVLTVRVDTQEAVYATRKDGTVDPRFFTAEAYGAYVGMSPNIVLTGTSSPNIPQFDTFRPASVQSMNFHFQLSQQATLDKQLRDSWLQPGARDVPYGSLSDQFRAKAEEIAKRMANSKATINVGGAPLGVRPPSA